MLLRYLYSHLSMIYYITTTSNEEAILQDILQCFRSTTHVAMYVTCSNIQPQATCCEKLIVCRVFIMINVLMWWFFLLSYSSDYQLPPSSCTVLNSSILKFTLIILLALLLYGSSLNITEEVTNFPGVYFRCYNFQIQCVRRTLFSSYIL